MYYMVMAKCGHVRKNRYIIKPFYVTASSAKMAAKIVRNMPRVKHHHKDAIRSVKHITKKEYKKGIVAQKSDPYFFATNSSEQRLLSAVDYDDVRNEEPTEYRHQRRNTAYVCKKRKILEKDYAKQIQEVI